MKTMIKKALIVIMLFMTTLSYASEIDNKLKVEVTGAKTFNLIIEDLSPKVKIFLKDKNGYILYKEDISDAKNFMKKFNLNALPEGDYFLELEDETRFQVLPIEVAANQVSYHKSSEVVRFKPVVRKKGDYVDVSLLSLEKAPLKIAIYDSYNRLLFEETLQGTMNLGRKYDMSKVGKGDYRFLLECNGRIYTKIVHVNSKPNI